MRLTLSRYRFRNTFIAGGLAIVGALLVLLYVASYRNDVQNGAGPGRGLRGGQATSPRAPTAPTVAGGGYLKKETVLKRNVVSGAITEPDARSRTSPPRRRSSQGEQITTRQFHPAAEQGVLANISGNQRAMTVPGDATSLLAGIVKDGDHVDVLANINYVVRQPAAARRGGDLRRVASRVILRDLLVLRAPDDAARAATIGGGAAELDHAGADRRAGAEAAVRDQERRLVARAPAGGEARRQPGEASRRSSRSSPTGSASARSTSSPSGYGAGSIGSGG